MIRLFRINDPLRVLVALLFLVGMRVPFLLSEKWILSAEIDWLIVGESLGNGNLIYADVWSTIPPLAAGFYWGIVSLFGKSVLSLRILAIILVILQALVLNRALIRQDIYNEKTYIPALLYVLFMNISTDFMTLSPQLLSLTFLILALNYLLKPEERGRNDELLSAGIYLGVAFFFNFSAIFYLFLSVVIIILFRASSWRGILNLFYGFLSIVVIHISFFFISDGLPNFAFQYLSSIFVGGTIHQISITDLLIQLSIPILLLIIAVIRVFRETAFINYQVSCQQIMVLWGIVAGLSILSAPRFNPSQFIFIVPVLSFFVAHQLLLIRKKIAEIYINGIIVITFILGVSGIFFQKSEYWPINYEGFWANLEISKEYENQKIIVLGESNEYYLNNRLATPYLNWDLANDIHFSRMNQYSVIQSVYDAFSTNPPVIIIDEKGVMDKVFYHIPELSKKYDKVSDKIYKLKSAL